MQTRYECPYDGCSWTHTVDSTTNVDDALALGFDEHGVVSAHVERSAMVEVALGAHLDADHPGWTLADLVVMAEERATAQRAQAGAPCIYCGKSALDCQAMHRWDRNLWCCVSCRLRGAAVTHRGRPT